MSLIRARVQKILILMIRTGSATPTLEVAEHLCSQPTSLSKLKGSPVFLFFWVHWCGDCKAEEPILARLLAEFASSGLKVAGPTRLYGYAARGEDATPQQELAYIESVK